MWEPAVSLLNPNTWFSLGVLLLLFVAARWWICTHIQQAGYRQDSAAVARLAEDTAKEEALAEWLRRVGSEVRELSGRVEEVEIHADERWRRHVEGDGAEQPEPRPVKDP